MKTHAILAVLFTPSYASSWHAEGDTLGLMQVRSVLKSSPSSKLSVKKTKFPDYTDPHVCSFGGDCHAFSTFSKHLTHGQGSNGLFDLMVAGTVPMLKTPDGQFEAEYFQCPVDVGVLSGFNTVHGFAIRNGDNILQAAMYWDPDFDRDWQNSFANWVNPVDTWTAENYKTRIAEDCQDPDCLLSFDFEYYSYASFGRDLNELKPHRLIELFGIQDDNCGGGCIRGGQHTREEAFWQAHVQKLEAEGKKTTPKPSSSGPLPLLQRRRHWLFYDEYARLWYRDLWFHLRPDRGGAIFLRSRWKVRVQNRGVHV